MRGKTRYEYYSISLLCSVYCASVNIWKLNLFWIFGLLSDTSVCINFHYFLFGFFLFCFYLSLSSCNKTSVNIQPRIDYSIGDDNYKIDITMTYTWIVFQMAKLTWYSDDATHSLAEADKNRFNKAWIGW